MNSQEDKSDKKYQDYKKRIREIEEENDNISSQLAKARHHIKRLRVERIVLLEEIDELRQGGGGRSRGFNKKSSTSSAGALGSSGLGNVGGESDSEMSVSESIISEVKGNTRKNASATPRKKRDPNAPKGPGNVFFLYCRMERDNIKDEVPNESLGEVTRLLGQKWKALPKEEKQKYYDIYGKEMKEYEEAMKSYTAAGGGVEGAAAVEAANKVKQEKSSSALDDEGEELEEEEEEEDEEFDMLQDEDEELEGEEILDDDEDMEPPSSSGHLTAAAEQQPKSNQSTPMPETPNNTTLNTSNNTTPTNHTTTTTTL